MSELFVLLQTTLQTHLANYSTARIVKIVCSLSRVDHSRLFFLSLSSCHMKKKNYEKGIKRKNKTPICGKNHYYFLYCGVARQCGSKLSLIFVNRRSFEGSHAMRRVAVVNTARFDQYLLAMIKKKNFSVNIKQQFIRFVLCSPGQTWELNRQLKILYLRA